MLNGTGCARERAVRGASAPGSTAVAGGPWCEQDAWRGGLRAGERRLRPPKQRRIARSFRGGARNVCTRYLRLVRAGTDALARMTRCRRGWASCCNEGTREWCANEWRGAAFSSAGQSALRSAQAVLLDVVVRELGADVVGLREVGDDAALDEAADAEDVDAHVGEEDAAAALAAVERLGVLLALDAELVGQA